VVGLRVVGNLLGLSVVGRRVGPAVVGLGVLGVGTGVGSRVGLSVGEGEGEGEGCTVGAGDGCSVVGAAVVGAGDGCSVVGAGDGCSVVGAAVVGDGVGSRGVCRSRSVGDDELRTLSATAIWKSSWSASVLFLPCFSSSAAATPATCGAAMDVPVMTISADVESLEAAVMDTPGANKSTHAPKLLPM
jgi:hypothetical protein